MKRKFIISSGIFLISFISFLVFLVMISVFVIQDSIRTRRNEINDIKNRICYILFFKCPKDEEGKAIYSFTVKVIDEDSMNRIAKLIEDAKIFKSGDKFDVQMQNRDGTLFVHLIFDDKTKYDRKFQSIIDKLMKSKYKNTEYEKLVGSKNYKKIYRGDSEEVDDKICEKISSVESNDSMIREINKDDFVEFMRLCSKNKINEKKNIEIKNIDNGVERGDELDTIIQ